MPVWSRKSQAVAIILSLSGLLTPAAAGKRKEKPVGAMDEQKRAVHAINRLTFGPRAGDVKRVSQMGVDKWIDLQLHPEKINDSALDERLASFLTLRMNNRELAENFPNDQVIKQIADGKADLPRDPVKRAIYQAQLQRFEIKQDRKEEKETAQPNDEAILRNKEDRIFGNLKAEQLQDMPPDQRFSEVIRMPPADQHALMELLKGPKAEKFTDGMGAEQKEALMALNHPGQVVANELMQAKLIRAIYSERQLDEVMTDFWFNHFNVFINKGADRYLLTSYERNVIRPHALGKFEDLLVATAHSPAMLFYLDNWQSVGPDSDVALGIPSHRNDPRRRPGPPFRPQRPNRKPASGLNENYGRELMELHTLSVNGGYSQKDVTEVAKVFTGWTIDKPERGGEFKFDPRMHQPGDKFVLGHRIKSNAEKEGFEVLHMLARSPKTAHFISQKLAMRFVSDDPPPELVDQMAKTFLKKDGDIREVLKTMFKSPEFWSPDAYRAKVKTPLEFVVSAVRASGAEVDDARQLVGTLNNMGMMPYGMQPPTGYSMKAETWVSSSALLGRMNFALGLAAGRIRGTSIDASQLAAGATDPQAALASLENSLLAGDVSKQTHDSIVKRFDDPQISNRKLDDASRPPNVAAIAGLILGSPEFQKR
jgi:uncharacterized protein (DUF1800 family)